ncbi:unnamed protein product [Rotaria sp. Silwood2]|nr:unnamed protein product [Rotaria sp. Silwood2]CAF3105247.1 unnamed protein product [Rotaria sp. Silwood2]CAF4405207.1 unnamed protein product [Rotaria sp. Silwood2]CAF4458431.1 unnamed protein product [Rotaria sp. Silwood2]
MDNSILIWLIDKTREAEETLQIDELTQYPGLSIESFTDIDEFFDFLTQIIDEKILIISEPLITTVVSIFHDVSILHSIYVLSSDTIKNEDHISLLAKYYKVQDIYTDLSIMSNIIKKNLKLVDNNFQSTNILPVSHFQSTTEPDKIDSMFMYCQLLKEIFLERNHDEEEAKRKSLEFCRQEYDKNRNALQVIDEFLRE